MVVGVSKRDERPVIEACWTVTLTRGVTVLLLVVVVARTGVDGLTLHLIK